MGQLKREHRQADRTPEELAELRREHARFSEERPGPDDLIDSGDVEEYVPHGQFMELACLVARLKAARESKGLSLADVAERSGMTRAAISRLGNGWNANPTLDTLFRY